MPSSSSSSSSSASNSDEENEDFGRQLKLYRKSNNYFELYSDDEFFASFRLSKTVVRTILDDIEHLIKVPNQRGGCIKPMHQLLLTLRFYALGNVLKTVGDFIGVSKASASRIVLRVTNAIVSLRSKYIKMPETQLEMKQIAENFHRRSRISNVIGSMDCTFIRIQFPGVEDSETFRCKKGYFALKVQGVSDENLKFKNIVAHCPGSTVNQSVFDNSKLKREFESGRYGQYILVGNASYESEKYLLVEQVESQTKGESACKERLSEIRNFVEKMFSEWKKRFPILSSGIRLDMETTVSVIVATAILHNIAKEMKDDLPVDWYQGVILDADQIRQKLIDEC
ncbi:PREDICTED: uncharacterized protein LOC108567998 [Nicrophorus vespilloides]|uniref:Uncharacterized protein LOC108567998 n=1 Tax=Nicrophorus vespilloides TaxID=110193 RepID=A0ABM1NBX6_NICVS|nr:PREDICTED: uncharacterized protein LOC108567998 [Nicrophorus vespilloides]